jgi:hypothetical protein
MFFYVFMIVYLVILCEENQLDALFIFNLLLVVHLQWIPPDDRQ